jgi:hypothetical protein
MSILARHPQTGAPLLRHEVHALGLDGLLGRVCGICAPGEASDGPTCPETPVAEFVLRFRCTGMMRTPICAEHLRLVLEQLAANPAAPRIITPGLN